MVFAEVFITFEVVSFLFFIKATDTKNTIFFLMAAIMFFTLGISAFNLQSIYTNTNLTSYEGVYINFGMGVVSMIYVVVLALTDFGKQAEEHEDDE